ncbi:MAG: FAD-binding oxidoreductase [Chlorobi bacterium]|nr:MAG: FAD/FMN-containing dehydrogenase [Chlorobi bacterium OLB7]MBK8912450.1 FAD-binding oxidoreductase [Chlorobiota bacterium]MBX7217636.1 FAD-binding oxidoreductase [Candidatus Kapabacteria bacterium]
MLVRRDPDSIYPFLRDASNLAGGMAEAVWFPQHEEEVVEVLKAANQQGKRVTVSGGRTGLVGGAVPQGGAADGWILSTERICPDPIIERADPTKPTITAGAGTRLFQLREAAAIHGLFLPPDPTEPTCTIGGMVATNASGAHTFRYGATRQWVEQLHVVLASGERLRLGRGEAIANGTTARLQTLEGSTLNLTIPDLPIPSIKNASGYFLKSGMDLVDLFIGMEGTLGVVTAVTFRVIPIPSARLGGVIFFRALEPLLRCAAEIRTRSRNPNDPLTSNILEFADQNALELVRQKFARIPDGAIGGAIWIEQDLQGDSDEQAMAEWLSLFQRHKAMMEESWFGQQEQELERMRALRHAIPSAVYEYLTAHGQTKIGTDMAVPEDRFQELYSHYRQQFASSGLATVTYGHLGNCHLHANMLLRGGHEFQQAKLVYDSLVSKAIALGGTVSAEHGIGKLKRSYLRQMLGKQAMEAMWQAKQTLDPNNVLGVGTLF